MSSIKTIEEAAKKEAKEVWPGNKDMRDVYECGFYRGALSQENPEKRMRYLGVLGILCESSVYVPEDIRESIECAFEDACEDGRLKWKRILNRYYIEPVFMEPS